MLPGAIRIRSRPAPSGRHGYSYNIRIRPVLAERGRATTLVEMRYSDEDYRGGAAPTRDH